MYILFCVSYPNVFARRNVIYNIRPLEYRTHKCGSVLYKCPLLRGPGAVISRNSDNCFTQRISPPLLNKMPKRVLLVISVDKNA